MQKFKHVLSSCVVTIGVLNVKLFDSHCCGSFSLGSAKATT